MDQNAFRASPRTSCRICGSQSLYPYINLGDQPPSNSFISAAEIPAERTFPLIVNL